MRLADKFREMEEEGGLNRAEPSKNQEMFIKLPSLPPPLTRSNSLESLNMTEDSPRCSDHQPEVAPNPPPDPQCAAASPSTDLMSDEDTLMRLADRQNKFREMEEEGGYGLNSPEDEQRDPTLLLTAEKTAELVPDKATVTKAPPYSTFAGFSEDEDMERDDPPAPIDTHLASSSSVFFSPPAPVTAKDSTRPQETPPKRLVKRRGGDIGGGRTPVQLPFGCKMSYSEQAIPSYICICDQAFSEKRSLLRHHQACRPEEGRISSNTTSKRRKLEDIEGFNSSSSAEISPEQDNSSTIVFNEDPAGSKMLECKY